MPAHNTKAANDAKLERWTTMQKLWKDGAPQSLIAKQLGWSTKQLSVQLYRARKEGWDLPFRHPVKPKKRKHGRPKGR